MRGETVVDKCPRHLAVNFNPLPSCEGRLGDLKVLRLWRLPISIHSPHARGDLESAISGVMYDYFNPLPSCERRRGLRIQARAGKVRISIHSPHTRGDCVVCPGVDGRRHFNPLPSCEGRLVRNSVIDAIIGISIHSPHARGDGT